MCRRLDPGLLIIFLMIPALMSVSTGTGLCQDSLNGEIPGFRLRVFPISQALAQIPMPISFNGISGHTQSFDQADADAGLSVDGKTDIETTKEETSVRLTGIRAYLFQYIQLSALSSYTPRLNLSRESSGSGNKNYDNEYSIEFQADVKDLSGALLFVMKI